jgi:hypothetical protein
MREKFCQWINCVRQEIELGEKQGIHSNCIYSHVVAQCLHYIIIIIISSARVRNGSGIIILD